MSFTRRHSAWIAPILFFILAGLIYLPLVNQFGFFHDDWYLMYDAHVKGPAFFSTVFASDRPTRAFLQYALYILFGEKLIFYNISAYLFRVTGALVLWKIFEMVWPDNKRANLFAGALFLIYPGFLSQPNAVDFQAHLFSLMLALFSISLSLKACLTENRFARWTMAIASILLGWCYLGLMEYFIGLEVFRFGLIGLMFWRKQSKPFHLFLQSFARHALVFALSPAVFLIWRLFYFKSERRATDPGAQIGLILSSPLSTGLKWLITLAQDAINVLITAWVLPLYNLAFGLRLRDLLPAILVGLIAALIIWFLWTIWDDQSEHWLSEVLVIGIVTAAGGLIPVILANRHVDFANYSRYTLPALAGAVLLVSALLTQVRSAFLWNFLIIFLAVSAGMTHYANGVNAAAEAQATRNFWWQVAWRVPMLQKGTTLVADYPSIAIQEDYFVWGPANQIYYPQAQTGDLVQVPITAFVLTPQNANAISVGRGQDVQIRRGNETVSSYNNVLVISQPADNACVRALDGNQPEISENDRPEIMQVAASSRIGNIQPEGKAPLLPLEYFKQEPLHGWCYYYEKASLARQAGDWKSVDALGEKALAEGFYPSDKIEWMPFLQAYTILGKKDKLRPFVSILGEDPFIQKQACTILSASAANTDMLAIIKEDFCK